MQQQVILTQPHTAYYECQHNFNTTTSIIEDFLNEAIVEETDEVVEGTDFLPARIENSMSSGLDHGPSA